MDIDLLSKIVKELILDNDEVALPGIGAFVAEIVPSSFSDKGYTINPPYRRLAFRQKANGDENLLIDFYAKCNGLDSATASRIIREFMEEMRHVLETKKSVIFPGLGKLRATRENHFFFVADEDLDIYPEGFGLEPISLKTHEETPAEVSATMAALRSILNPEEEEADVPGQSSPAEAVQPHSTPESVEEVTGAAKETVAEGAAADNEPATSETADENAEGAGAGEVSDSGTDGSGVEEDIVASADDNGMTENTDADVEGTEGASEDNAADIAADEAEVHEISESVVGETEVQETSGAADGTECRELETAAGTPEDTEQPTPEDAEKQETTDASEARMQPVSETAEKPDQPIVEENSDAKSENAAEIIDSPAASAELPSEAGHTDKQDIQKAAAGDVMVDTSTANSGKRRAWRIVKWTLLSLVILAIMALVVFVILAHIAPDFIDSILYTPEELELLNL